MKNNGLLILAQADHLTGEELGFAIERIMVWGANNVYAFPGTTKKNRPGCLLLIDINPAKESKWIKLLAEELAIYGYHRILTSHYCSRCQVQTKNVVIQKGAVSLKTQVSFKSMTNGKGHCRIEHADLVRIKELLQQKLKFNVALITLRGYLESQYHLNLKGPIEICL